MLKKDITLNTKKFNEERKIIEAEKKKERKKSKFSNYITAHYLLLSSLRLILMLITLVVLLTFKHSPIILVFYICIFISSVIFVIFNKYTTKTTQVCDITHCFLWLINIMNYFIHPNI